LYQPYLNGAGVGTVGVGIILAVLSVVGAVGAQRIESVRRRLGETGLVWSLPLALALSFVLMGRFVAVWGVALLAVQSLVNGIYSPFSKELLNREIADSGQRATVLSVESMARRLAFGAFAPIAGVLIDAHGLSWALYLCAGAGFVGASLLVASGVRRRRRGLLDFAGEITPTPLPLSADDSAPISAHMHH
jgi:predicted MFS family arabinose efflux permease